MAKKSGKITLSYEIGDVFVSYRDKGFKRFFEASVKKALKNKSIYDIIEFCFNAGYWYAMRDIAGEKELYETSKKIVEEINKQEE